MASSLHNAIATRSTAPPVGVRRGDELYISAYKLCEEMHEASRMLQAARTMQLTWGAPDAGWQQSYAQFAHVPDAVKLRMQELNYHTNPRNDCVELWTLYNTYRIAYFEFELFWLGAIHEFRLTYTASDGRLREKVVSRDEAFQNLRRALSIDLVRNYNIAWHTSEDMNDSLKVLSVAAFGAQDRIALPSDDDDDDDTLDPAAMRFSQR